jgi:hypothetical protein
MQAAKNGASDIHIEPYERSPSVRFRVDGTLREVVQPNHALHAALISRLKIMAAFDIAEKRLPPDGRIGLRIGGRVIDVCVSTLPSAHGEHAVLRLLDKTEPKFSLESLGMSGIVLATVHTNDATSSVTRLIELGVEPYLLAASLPGTLAQCLVRKLCPHCKRRGDDGEWHPVGYPDCGHTGHKGRTGVYELVSPLRVTVKLKAAVPVLPSSLLAPNAAMVSVDGGGASSFTTVPLAVAVAIVALLGSQSITVRPLFASTAVSPLTSNATVLLASLATKLIVSLGNAPPKPSATAEWMPLPITA